MGLFTKKDVTQILDEAEHTKLNKVLTPKDLAALGIASVVGTGIFVISGVAASQYAGPAVIISFIITALAAFFAGLSYAELASMFPLAGSTYTYTYAAFGELIAWIIGWDLMLEYLVSAAAVASGWSAYFVSLLKNAGISLPHALTTTPINGGIIDLPAVIITFLVSWLLYLGIKETATSNNIVVVLKLLLLIVFIVVGAQHINPANWHPFAPFGWKGIMGGAAIIFFTFVGFDAVSTAAEETRNPGRDVPLGLIYTLIVVTILYIGVALVLTGMVSYKELNLADPLAYALNKYHLTWVANFISIGALIGMVATLLVTLYGQTRVFLAMARDGLLPKVFGKIHEKHKTPHVITWATAVVTAIFAGLLPIDILAELTNIGTLFAFVLVSFGVWYLRAKRPDIERKFKTPLMPLVPILAAGFSIYLMASLPVQTWWRFGAWLLVGLVIYFAYSRFHSKVKEVK